MRSVYALLGSLLITIYVAADDGMCTGPPPGLNSGSGSAGGCSSDTSSSHTAAESSIPYYVDISVTIDSGLPIWDGPNGLPCAHRIPGKDMRKGDASFNTHINFPVHTGTHIDMPSHFLLEEYEKGNFADKADLDTLMGPAVVVQVPVGSNITAEVLQTLDVHPDTERILFKTDSSAKDLLHQPAFHSAFTALTADGAKWIAENTRVRLLGIDYLSIATYEEVVQGHVELFKKGILVVEGLDLRSVEDGWYTLTCLPLKLGNSEGAPARCILTDAPPEYYTEARGEAAA